MSLDLFQQETMDTLKDMPIVRAPEAGMFDGFIRGSGMYAMQGFAKTAQAIDFLGSVGPIMEDRVTGGTVMQDKYFTESKDLYGSAVDFWTPKPNEVGTAGQVVGSLVSTLPTVILSPSLAVGSAQINAGKELVDKGATAGQAQGVGAVTGLGTGLGIWMPILGGNAWQRMVVGGAAGNIAQGVATRGASSAILGDSPLANEFKMLDPAAMTIDGLLGFAFGGLSHLSPAQREQGTVAWEKIANWAESLGPGDKAALATLKLGEHINVDSAPGKPVTAQDIEANTNRTRTAIEQLINGDPVNVENLPKANYEPNPEATAQSLEVQKALLEAAPEVAKAEGIEEHTPLVEQSKERIKLDMLDQLRATGRFDEDTNQSYAHLISSFYTTQGQRLGISPEEMYQRYPVKISDQPAGTTALAQEKTPIFHSELQRQLDAAPIKAAPAKEWGNYIKGLTNKGVKPEEVKWSGLEDWLAMQPGKVTKEQVGQFLKEGGVKVEEATLGNSKPEVVEKDGKFMVRKIDGSFLSSEFGPQTFREKRFADQALKSLQSYAPETKFSTYQLPGGENYKELLLTLPRNEGTKPAPLTELPPGYDVIEDSSQGEGRKFGITPPGQVHARPMGDRHPTAEAAKVEALKLVNNQRLSDWAYEQEKGGFKSSHFDQKNILAHVRFNERTDADGKKVLFLEELQSDWAQQGKKYGFREKLTAAEEARYSELDKISAKDLTPEQNKEYDALSRKKNADAPSGPFVGKTEAWVALALKRMIRYAAENGFDRVAWTTGEQQAARYDLSKQVDTVRVYRNAKGMLVMNAIKDGEVAIVKEVKNESELSDVIGKDVAKKAIEGLNEQEKAGEMQDVHLEGQDLKLGGEGMKAFYDKIVPNVANDVLKKLGGGRVEEVKIDRTDYGKNGKPADYNPAYSVFGEQPGFEVTPAMKEKALGTQALFQGGKEANRGEFDFNQTDITKSPSIISLLKDANQSTFLHETGHLELEVLNHMASMPDAPAGVKADLDTLMTWFGTDKAKWDQMNLEEKRPYHEQFARGFEQYLMEGNAPSPELKGIFQRFRDWLLDVYKSFQNLDVKINDEVRGVMDRLLASQERDPAGSDRVVPPAPDNSASFPPPPGGEKAPAGAAPDSVAIEAQRYVDANPDQLLRVGTTTDKQPVHMTAAEFLAQAKEDAARAREDVSLLEVAASCLLGRA